jgi:subtilisin family serine protease
MLRSRRRIPAPPGQPPRDAREHGRSLQRKVEDAILRSPPARPVEGVDPALVFKIRARTRLDDNTWRARGLEPVAESRDWTYFVLSRGDAPEGLREALTRYARGPTNRARAELYGFFDQLEDVEPYSVADRTGAGLPRAGDVVDTILVDILVWPSADADEALRRVRDVRTVLASTEARVVAVDPRPRFTVVRADVSGNALRDLLDLAVIEKVTPVPVPYIEPGDWLEIGFDEVELELRESAPIGIIDDDIGANPVLDGVVVSRRSFPSGHVFPAPTDHATKVAGLAAFGDLEDALRNGTPLLGAGPIHGARILGPDAQNPRLIQFPEGIPVHQLVEEAIRTLHAEEGVRVFNMSIALPSPFDGRVSTTLTEILDQLVRELGVIIIVPTGNQRASSSGSIGNGRHANDDYPHYVFEPDGRVSEPGAGALVVTVGSIARSSAPASPSGQTRPGDVAIAAAMQISPFSRTGRGAGDCLKPDFVHFGGNWVYSQPNATLEENNAGVGAISTTIPRGTSLFASSSGTSYAAPRVARVVADTWAAYPDASANMVRCLVALSATVPAAARRQVEQIAAGDADETEKRIRAFGLGVPRTPEATASSSQRVVLYFDGDIEADTVAIHPVPLPDPFRQGHRRRYVRVGLAYDPPVRRTRGEYLAGRMKFDLVRSISIEAVAEAYRRQDPDEPVTLPPGRARVSLMPGTTLSQSTALKVREFRFVNPVTDDGDTWYVVVTHRRMPWAESEDQTYALAVTLEEEAGVDIDLYALVEEQIRVRPRVRLRPRA